MAEDQEKPPHVSAACFGVIMDEIGEATYTVKKCLHLLGYHATLGRPIPQPAVPAHKAELIGSNLVSILRDLESVADITCDAYGVNLKDSFNRVRGNAMIAKDLLAIIVQSLPEDGNDMAKKLLNVALIALISLQNDVENLNRKMGQ